MNNFTQQLILWCIKHNYPLPDTSKDEGKYAGLRDCFKNVVRTNNSRKLQYCKPR